MNKRFTIKIKIKYKRQDLRVGIIQIPTLSTKPSSWQTKYSRSQLDFTCRKIAWKSVMSRHVKKLVRRWSGIRLFKTHDLRSTSMWTLKLSTIANPRNAPRMEEMQWHLRVSRNILNSTVLPTKQTTTIAAMQKSCGFLQVCACGFRVCKTKHTYVTLSHTLVPNTCTKETSGLWGKKKKKTIVKI